MFFGVLLGAGIGIAAGAIVCLLTGIIDGFDDLNLY